MADTQKVLEGNIQSFKELREEISRLKDVLAVTKEGTAEWTQAAEKLHAAQSKVNDINKAAKGTLNSLNTSSKNSINNLKELIKQKNLERNAMDMGSKEYKKATEELKKLNDRLRESATDAGDWKQNVGNYSSALQGAMSDLGTAATGLTGPIGAVNASLLKLAANPVGAAIAAIAAAMGSLAYGIKSSETNTNRFNGVLAPFKAQLIEIERATQKAASNFLDWAENAQKSEKAQDAMHKVLQVGVFLWKQLSDLIGTIVERFKAIEATFKRVREVIYNYLVKPLLDTLAPAINYVIDLYNDLAHSWLGKQVGLKTIERLTTEWIEAGDAANELINQNTKLAETLRQLDAREAQLAKNRRARAEANATYQSKINALDAEYAELRAKTERTEEEEAKMLAILNERKEYQEKIAKNNIATAQEEYNLLHDRNALTDSDTESLNAESDAKVALINATAQLDAIERDYQNALKKTNTQLKKDATQDAATARQEAADKLKAATAALNGALKSADAGYMGAQNNNQAPERFEDNQLTKSNIESYYTGLQEYYLADLEAYRAMTEQKIAALEQFIAVQKELGNDTSAQEAEIAKLKEAYTKKEIEAKKKVEDAEKNKTKALKANFNQQLNAWASLMDSMQGLFEENTVAYKAISIAKAIMDTYLAANNALATLPPPASYVAAAAAVTAGLANVAQIVKTNPSGESSAPSATNQAPTIVNAPQIDTNPYSYTRNIQSEDEEEEMLNQPTIVSVVDIENAMSKRRVRVSESTF